MNEKSYMDFRMVYLHLTLAHSKVQRQGHGHFDNELLGNGDRVKLLLPSNSKSSMGFHLAYLHLTLAIVKVKVKVKVMHISTMSI